MFVFFKKMNVCCRKEFDCVPWLKTSLYVMEKFSLIILMVLFHHNLPIFQRLLNLVTFSILEHTFTVGEEVFYMDPKVGDVKRAQCSNNLLQGQVKSQSSAQYFRKCSQLLLM